MAKHRASGDDQLTRQGVIETPGAAYWSVDGSRWPTVRPDLPADVADLLAPPIVVGVARVPVTSRLTPARAALATPSASAAVVAALEPVAVVAAAPAEPAPPPPTPTAPRPVPTPPLNPRPVPAPPPERPVPGPPATPRRNAVTGPVGGGRRGNAGPVVAGRHRRHNGASGRAG
ncbi:hypothetical protein [Micromonospora sp. NPDC005979]|uniref:hypothetical protein n=1 Tax=Micromonospora sp. NPDC005979 TaxID=3156726 RepID=UPI0033A8E3C0